MAGLARGRWIAVAVVAAALLAPQPAPAELYRCVGAGGRVSFTDNPGSCPTAKPHQPPDVIQKGPPPAPPAAPAASRAVLRDQAEQDHARTWREKKRHMERELAMLQARRDDIQEYAVWCKRGGDIYRKDAAGLKQKVSCGSVHAEVDRLEKGIAAARAYLEEGLAEECRRAGCLPGWIR